MSLKSVLIVPPLWSAPEMFESRGYRVVSKPHEADALVFMGGADIDPAFYGEERMAGTYTHPDRDAREKAVFDLFAGKKPMIGICRGAQFLNCMAGGKLWQHVDNHNGRNHTIFLRDKDGNDTNISTTTNSLHHQMMRPTKDARILAYAKESTTKIAQNETIRHVLTENSRFPEDPEIVWYPNEQFYCVQGHPEFGHKPLVDVVFKHLEELF